MSDAEIQTVSSNWAGLQRVAMRPKPPEYFEGRTGYDHAFFGEYGSVGLPSFTAAINRADISTLADGSVELKYQHFSTVQCISRRMPFFSACNVDGSQTKSVPRHDTWSFDGRIPVAHQTLKEAYGPQKDGRFSRGHMTRRQDPVWGSWEIAERANLDTFFATNACPQWQPFNDGLWGDLEDYVLGNARSDAKRLSVFSGPIFADEDPEVVGVRIPRDFWKVVAFVSERTSQLAAIAYVMGQGDYLDAGLAADLEDFELSQRPLAYITERTGLDFADLNARDVLAGADLSFAKPIRRASDSTLVA